MGCCLGISGFNVLPFTVYWTNITTFYRLIILYGILNSYIFSIRLTIDQSIALLTQKGGCRIFKIISDFKVEFTDVSTHYLIVCLRKLPFFSYNSVCRVYLKLSIRKKMIAIFIFDEYQPGNIPSPLSGKATDEPGQ